MPTSTPHVIEAGAANFRDAVIERSFEVPVVVDFWATWCGPCRTLGPILEKLAAEYGGAFVLAKVDTDREVEVAQMFQIQSIPSVKLVSQGRLVDGFDGALPEHQVRKFLEAYVQPVGDPLAAATVALERGDVAGARKAAEAALAKDPQRNEARLVLAEAALAAGDAAAARAALDALPEDLRNGNAGRRLAARLEFAALGDVDVAALERAVAERPGDVAAKVALGRGLAASRRFEEALDVLLAAVMQDREFDDQAARRAMLEVFDALGPDDDLVADYRRRLQMALFV